ncbi:cilia- and flagella-associated protein 57-like [Hyalella azteca]|uniref:Cilia- and flagella-associated protein 57-like n=1 Tax=Hyalella azteca TaxID=294128 RepID=A0A979FJB5_HYAAZ|nr:cilia- and flagella-associated protein 57-like [Hyalella azteca]
MFNGSFACACGPDKIFLFQRSENIHEFYLQRQMLLLCEPSPASLVSGRGQHTVTSLSADPSGTTLVLSTHSGQIFTNAIPALDDSLVTSSVFRPLHTHHHVGAVISADVCQWKTYCATIGRDRTFLLWDYSLQELLLQETFKEDLYSVALHPTGLHAAVSLTDSVRLYHVMMAGLQQYWEVLLGQVTSLHAAVSLTDSVRLYHVMMGGLQQYWEVRVRRCGSCSFSHGGQYLAAADGSVVTVVHTIALRRHLALKGHAGKIQCVGWHPGDHQVFATAAEGVVLAWDVATGTTALQLQTAQGCQYFKTFLSLDSKASLIAGSSSHLVEVSGGQLMQEEAVEDVSCVGVAPVKTLLALGQSSGALLLTRAPRSFAAVGPMRSSPAHAGRVTAICVTRDEGCLVTCGEDGVVVVWGVADVSPDAPGALVAKERLLNLPPLAPEMLVTRQQLETTERQVRELSNEVQYLTRDKRHHLTLQQQQHDAAFADLQRQHLHQIQELQHHLEVSAALHLHQIQELQHHLEIQELQNHLEVSAALHLYTLHLPYTFNTT